MNKFLFFVGFCNAPVVVFYVSPMSNEQSDIAFVSEILSLNERNGRSPNSVGLSDKNKGSHGGMGLAHL